MAIARLLGVATLAGSFLGFIGAFGTMEQPPLARIAQCLPFSWIGSLLGYGCARLVFCMPWADQRPWAAGAVSATVMIPPMSMIVWLSYLLVAPPGLPIRALPNLLSITATMCFAGTALGVALRQRARGTGMTLAGPTPPKFLERLPLKLRGAEVWAVEAQDHYLRLHTSKGQDLILLRLADAIAELEGLEGAQVHRSWWVARDAITEARRGDGRATLTLKDGSEVPVSRTYARHLRERRWI